MPPDCVKVPMPLLPMYWFAAINDPHVILETVSFTVRLPLPKLTTPVPESSSPLLKLMAPPLGLAVIVPWQLTGSLIEICPLKPFPAGTMKVEPAVYVKPKVLKLPKPENPDGRSNKEFAPILTEVDPMFCHVPMVILTTPFAISVPAALPPSKIPVLIRVVLTWSVPPPRK